MRATFHGHSAYRNRPVSHDLRHRGEYFRVSDRLQVRCIRPFSESAALTIDDLQGMEIFKGERDLARVEKSRFEIERRLAPHVGKQFAARHIVEEHVEKLLGPVCPMQMDDERVLNG